MKQILLKPVCFFVHTCVCEKKVSGFENTWQHQERVWKIKLLAQITMGNSTPNKEMTQMSKLEWVLNFSKQAIPVFTLEYWANAI